MKFEDSKIIVYLSKIENLFKSDAILSFIELGGFIPVGIDIPTSLEIYFMIFLLAIDINGLVNEISAIYFGRKLIGFIYK